MPTARSSLLTSCRKPSADDYLRAAAALGEAAELAATFGVRLALEFQKSSPFCACLETALALIAQSGAANAGVCLDVFHFYTGPSKSEDLAHLTPQNLAWVQVCDLSGTPRELAGDSDRILPGEGDFPARSDHRAPGADRLRRLRLARGAQPSSLAGRLRSGRRPGPSGPSAACWARGSQSPAEVERRALGVSSVATLQPAAVVYREEQYFDWRVYALIALGEMLTGLRLAPRARLVARVRARARRSVWRS